MIKYTYEASSSVLQKTVWEEFLNSYWWRCFQVFDQCTSHVSTCINHCIKGLFLSQRLKREHTYTAFGISQATSVLLPFFIIYIVQWNNQIATYEIWDKFKISWQLLMTQCTRLHVHALLKLHKNSIVSWLQPQQLDWKKINRGPWYY